MGEGQFSIFSDPILWSSVSCMSKNELNFPKLKATKDKLTSAAGLGLWWNYLIQVHWNLNSSTSICTWLHWFSKSNIWDLKYPENLREFDKIFKDDESCLKFLEKVRWKDGFECQACGGDKYWLISTGLLWGHPPDCVKPSF